MLAPVEIPFIEGTKLKQGNGVDIETELYVEIPFIEGTKLKLETVSWWADKPDLSRRNPFY